MIILSLGLKKETPEEEFWRWFKKNETMLFEFTDSNMEEVFDKLAEAMKKVHPDLTFEFSPILKNGKREFVISAGGLKVAFHKVESLFKSAPKLKKWTWIKFRPRGKPMILEFKGIKFDPEIIKCQMFKDGKKVGIMVFFKDYSEKKKNLFGQAGFLLLDQALGEYDVATKIGFIEFKSTDSKFYKQSFPFKDLAKKVDSFYKKRMTE